MSGYEQGGGSESVVVNGTVEGVEIKPNGRFVVKVREIGSTSNYAVNLNTKEQALANQMMNAIGQQFSFICGLSHWTNQSGQPVTSKWINGVAPLSVQSQYQPPMPQQQPQPFAGQPQGFAGQPAAQPWPQQQPPQAPQPLPPPLPQPQASGQWGPDTIRRVSWLAALEPAIAMLDHLPEEQRGVPAVLKMADFFAQTAIQRGEHGFSQDGGNPGPQTAPEPQGYGGHPDFIGQPSDEYGTPPPGDEDVPF